jgi:hypothetical protein
MMALGPGSNRATSFLEWLPESIAIDDDPALVDDPIEKKRRLGFDPGKVRDVDDTAGGPFQTRREARRRQWPTVDKVDEQVEVGVLVLVSTRQRSIEHRQADATLGSQRLAKFEQVLPTVAQILLLSRGEPQSSGTGTAAAKRPLGRGAAQCALLST